MAAAVAIYLALFVKHRLAPGEKGKGFTWPDAIVLNVGLLVLVVVGPLV